MFGINGKDVSLETAMSCIVKEDLEIVSNAFFEAQKSWSNGRYQAEFDITNAAIAKKQIAQAVGKTYFDLEDKLVKVVGIVLMVTIQREIQSILEALVEQRTQELVVIYDELAASNQEYTAFNEVLSESNSLPMSPLTIYRNCFVNC